MVGDCHRCPPVSLPLLFHGARFEQKENTFTPKSQQKENTFTVYFLVSVVILTNSAVCLGNFNLVEIGLYNWISILTFYLEADVSKYPDPHTFIDALVKKIQAIQKKQNIQLVTYLGAILIRLSAWKGGKW